jgi:hypothetical protein
VTGTLFHGHVVCAVRDVLFTFLDFFDLWSFDLVVKYRPNFRIPYAVHVFTVHLRNRDCYTSALCIQGLGRTLLCVVVSS